MKLFIISDIHGFYDEMIEALKKAGFDKNNPNHLLIGLGDYWDRGLKPKQVMDYLLSLPNKVLIKGNHEDLIIDLCRRKFTKSHDYSNGTVLTLGALSPDANSYKELFENGLKLSEEFQADMKDYFETSNYIFVHGWIPVNITSKDDNVNDTNWRNSDKIAWKEARWSNGIDMANAGLIEPNKTIVCGHYHCSYGHYLDKLKNKEDVSEDWQYNENAIWDPYYGNGIIAIDRCTAITGKVNVLILEDELLEKD